MASIQAFRPLPGGEPKRLRSLLYLMLTLVMLLTVLFGVPVA
jgi:hypothetical protein